MSKREPKGTRKALRNVSRGLVSVTVKSGLFGDLSPVFIVYGRMFHPKQKPYDWLLRHGYIEVDQELVVLTKRGKVKKNTLRPISKRKTKKLGLA